MQRKYNIAFTPMNISERVIQLPNNIPITSHHYVLGENSLPHLTLSFFIAEENTIDNLWEKIDNHIKEKTISLTFKKISCISFDEKIFWISLLPESTELLHNIQHQVISLLQNPLKKTFDPHMTLLSTTHSNQYEDIAAKALSAYLPITDTFRLSLGTADQAGQFTKLIFPH